MSNYIGNQPSFGEFKKLDSIVSSFNGSTTQFDLDYNTVNQSVGDSTQLIVSLNGIVQEPGAAYTLGIGGGSIVFSSAPASTDTCHIVLLGGVGQTSTPSDGAVTASKLDASLKDYLEETYTADGTQTTYTLTRAALGANSLMLSIDGIVQPSTAFSVSGTTLTISPALPNTTNVRVVHMGVQSGVFVPANNSITAAQIGSLGANLVFDDNSKAVFGEGSDLQIYHDGSHSYIVDNGTGDLHLSAANFYITNAANTENHLSAIDNGAVTAYYDGAPKLATTSTGVDITGTLTSDALYVDGTTQVDNYGSTTGKGRIQFGNSGQKFIEGFDTGNAGSGSYLKFGGGSTTQMTLDSSGHLLVGQSSSTQPGVGNTTNGFAIRNDGLFFSSAYQGRTGTFGRNGNYGDILGFYKDGTRAGSVGSQTTGLYIDGESGHAGIRFGSAAVVPRDAQSDSNGGVDLGDLNTGFRDLYLTGGIQFDSRSNKLDDYEEGTWVPSLLTTGTQPSVTYSGIARGGKYVKVGRLVTVNFSMRINAHSGGTGTYLITGLPFTTSTAVGDHAGVSVGGLESHPISATSQPIQVIDNNSTHVRMLHANNNTGWSSYTPASQFAIYMSFSYETNS